MTTLHEQLLSIEQRILTWPESVPTWAPDNIHPDDAFVLLEQELEQLLSRIPELPEDERQDVKDMLAVFHANIQQHHDTIESALSDMRATVDQSAQYVRAVRAYTAR